MTVCCCTGCFEVPQVDRHKLLLYLEAHNLSIRDFLSVIKGEKLPRFQFMWNFVKIKERHYLHIVHVS